MNNAETYPFIAVDTNLGEAALRPSVTLTLINEEKLTETFGLLDTGASVNVLPYETGLELGYQWEKQTVMLKL